MSAWAGLAAGANAYMQIKLQDKKDALLTKLEKDREDRAQAIKIADEDRAEARDNKKVHTTETTLSGGKYVTEYRNANGDVIKSEDASPDDIEKINTAKLKDKLTLDNLQSTTDLAHKQLANYDTDHSIEQQVKQAQVGELNRHFNPAYGYGQGKTGKAASYTAPSKSSLESAFGVTDENGKTRTDPKQAAKFGAWRADHQDIPDGDQALDAYMADLSSDKKYKQGLVAGGVPAPLVDDVADSLKKGGEYVTPKDNMNMSPEKQASRDQGLVLFKRAQAAIAAGMVTREEAKAQLRNKYHYPALAEKL